MIPLIILHKIYWYKWRNSQYLLCKEYHQKINYYINDQFFAIKFENNHKDKFYNYRLLNSILFKSYSYNIIIHYNKGIVAKLPTNYYYSNNHIPFN